MNHLISAFSGADNASIDLGRVLWAAGCLAFLVFEGMAVWRTGAFDMTGFGVGFGGLLMAGGGALLLKRGTEPPGPPT